MANLETTYLKRVNDHFPTWIEPLSFPEHLLEIIDFDTFYLDHKAEGTGEATGIQKDIYWKGQAQEIKRVADSCILIRQQYRDELIGLVDEIERNSFNFPQMPRTHPKYVEKIVDLFRLMNQQTIVFDKRWEDDENKFGFRSFSIIIHSIYPSKYKDQIINSLDDILIHITSSIFDLKSLTSQLLNKLIDFFPEIKIDNFVTSTPQSSDKKENLFNLMPLEEVRRWFKQLTVTNSKNGNPFLTVKQVDLFVDRAFCQQPLVEKLSINAQNGDKGKVIGFFHRFYTYCVTHQSSKGKIDPVATTDKYIRLLTDNFDNWLFEQVKNNFRSGGDWK